MNGDITMVIPRHGEKVVLLADGDLQGSFVQIAEGASSLRLEASPTVRDLLEADTAFDGRNKSIEYRVQGLVRVELPGGVKFQMEAFYESKTK